MQLEPITLYLELGALVLIAVSACGALLLLARSATTALLAGATVEERVVDLCEKGEALFESEKGRPGAHGRRGLRELADDEIQRLLAAADGLRRESRDPALGQSLLRFVGLTEQYRSQKTQLGRARDVYAAEQARRSLHRTAREARGSIRELAARVHQTLRSRPAETLRSAQRAIGFAAPALAVAFAAGVAGLV